MLIIGGAIMQGREFFQSQSNSHQFSGVFGPGDHVTFNVDDNGKSITLGNLNSLLFVNQNAIELETPAVVLVGLPVADPHSGGQLWNNGGVLAVSAG